MYAMKSTFLLHLKNTVMASNLLDSVRGYLTPDLIDRTSSHLGEPTSSINKALTAAVPGVFGMFMSRAERGDAQGLLHDAHEADDNNVLSNPQRLISGSSGSFLSGGIDRLQSMFGGNAGGLISSIANFAGIRTSSAQGLLSILTPLGLGVLGRHARENNLSAQGLTSYLSSQRSSIMGALPSGFSLGSLFGSREERTSVREDDNTSRAQGVETVREPRKTNWVPLLLLGLGVIALLWFLARRGSDNDRENTVAGASTPMTTTTTTDTHAARATVPTDNTAGRERTNVRLANGQELNAFRGGVEDQLVTCLNEAGCAAGKDQWYDFDNINFETGSAQLTAASQQQVQNIATILNAYPKAKIKIGGYTDKTGNAAANKRLSQQRADAVKRAIIAAGAKANQIVGAEGYGSEFAKVDASASDAERKKDRRIAVQLREK